MASGNSSYSDTAANGQAAAPDILTQGATSVGHWVDNTLPLAIDHWEAVLVVAVLAIPVYLALKEVTSLLFVLGKSTLGYIRTAIASRDTGAGFAPARIGRSFAQGLKYVYRQLRNRDVSPRYLVIPTGPGVAELITKANEIWNYDYSAKEFGVGESLTFASHEGEVVLPDWESVIDDAAWEKLLGKLLIDRPERPLDGVLLTVSASQLLQGDDAGLVDTVKRLQSAIASINVRLQFALPVYMLVGNCEAVPGFAEFWRGQDDAQLKQIFGWSNAAQDGSFDADAVPEIFSGIVTELQRIQLLQASQETHIENVDAFYSFPYQLESMLTPLHKLCKQLFRDITLLERNNFRGIYFFGRTRDSQSAGHSRQAFLADLFSRKIFAEANIGFPLSQRSFSRNQNILRYQLSTIVFAFLAVVLLAYDYRSLDVQVRGAVNAINRINETLGTPPSRNRVFELISSMAHLDASTYYRPAIPRSWFGTSNQKLQHYLGEEVFTKGIFPNLQCALYEKYNTLRGPTDRPHSGSAAGGTTLFNDWFGEFTAFDANNYRFRMLSTPGTPSDRILQDFGNVVSYVYGQKLELSFYSRGDIYSRALIDVSYQAVPETITCNLEAEQRWPEVLSERLLQVAAQQVDAFSESAARKMVLPLVLESVLAGEPISQAHNLTAVKLEIDAYYDSLQRLLQDWLSPGTSNPCTQTLQLLETYHEQTSMRVSPGGQAQLAELFDSVYTAVNGKLTQLFGDDKCAAPVRERLSSAAGKSPFRPTSDGVEIDPEIVAISKLFQNLSDFPVINAPLEKVDWLHDKAFSWDAAVLGQARDFLRDYPTITQRANEDAVQLLRSSVMSAVHNAVGRAQLRAVSKLHDKIRPASIVEAKLAKQIASFRAAGPVLIEIEQLLGQHEFDALREELAMFNRAYAIQKLRDVDRLAGQSRLYRQLPAPNWDGLDYADALFGLRNQAQVSDYLAAQLSRVSYLAHQYAEPLVVYLLNSSASDSSADYNAVSRWRETLVQLDRYQNNDPAGEVALLDQFFKDQLLDKGRKNCSEGIAQSASSRGLDWFSHAQGMITDSVDSYCRQLVRDTIKTDYQSLAKNFNDPVFGLAGKYPFAANKQVSVAEVRQVERFFQTNSVIANGLAGRMAQSGQLAQGPEAVEFVGQMHQVEQFFRHASLGLANASELNLTMVANFLPATNSPSQLLYWWLDSGNLSLRNPPLVAGTEPRITWSFGDPLRLRLQWANESSVAPVVASSNPAVEGNFAVFSQAGPWALLRWLKERKVPAGSIKERWPGSTLLKFDASIQKRDGSAAATGSSYYLALRIFGIDPDTNLPVLLSVPTFPASAPALE